MEIKREILVKFFNAVISTCGDMGVPITQAQNVMLWHAVKRNEHILTEGLENQIHSDLLAGPTLQPFDPYSLPTKD